MEKIIYRRSFASKLIVNRDLTLEAYQQIKDCCSTHEKIKTRLSFNHETITLNRKKIGMMRVARKNMSLYLDLEPSKYIGTNIEDLSAKKTYEKTPLMILIKNKKTLAKAIELLEVCLSEHRVEEIIEAEDIDYSEVFYDRSFEVMLEEGLIKKYVRKRIEGKYVEVEVVPNNFQVDFTAKLMYEATNSAEELFIITSYDNWSLDKAIRMNKDSNQCFKATASFPEDTKLEFKVCRATSWNDVEKGIWKEEIKNHKYLIVDKNLDVEDLIYNFRNNN